MASPISSLLAMMQSKHKRSADEFPWHEADAMFLLLIRRAADLQLGADGPEHEELDCLQNAIEAYQAKRFTERPG
jgi:hypothetical protein